MKDILNKKWIFCFIVDIFLLFGLTSCLTSCPNNVPGGYIIIKNNRNVTISVDITDSNYYPVHSDYSIPPNTESGHFWIKDDGLYWVRVYENYARVPYKSVYFGPHEDVIVIIE